MSCLNQQQFIVPLLVAARTKVGDQMVNRASDHDDILSKDIVEDLKDVSYRAPPLHLFNYLMLPSQSGALTVISR